MNQLDVKASCGSGSVKSQKSKKGANDNVDKDSNKSDEKKEQFFGFLRPPSAKSSNKSSTRGQLERVASDEEKNKPRQVFLSNPSALMNRSVHAQMPSQNQPKGDENIDAIAEVNETTTPSTSSPENP